MVLKNKKKDSRVIKLERKMIFMVRYFKWYKINNEVVFIINICWQNNTMTEFIIINKYHFYVHHT